MFMSVRYIRMKSVVLYWGENAPKAQTKECHCDSLGSLRIALIAHGGPNVM